MTKDSRLQHNHCWLQPVLWLVMLLFSVPSLGQAPVQIELLLSEAAQPYQDLASAFQSELSLACDDRCRSTPSVRVSRIDDWQASAPRDLLVAVGNKAALHAVVSHPQKLIIGLIPQDMWRTLERIHPSPSNSASSIYLEQPINRQFKLIAETLPVERRRIGILLGPDSIHYENALREAAALYGIPLVIRHVHAWEDVGHAMESLIGQIDVLLAVPDPIVFNHDTLYGILLISYGAGIPVIGYSEALVNAGAMLSLYTSVPNMARHLAQETAEFILNNGALPAAGPSRYYEIAVNQNVARSLGFDMPDASVLHPLLQSNEGRNGASQTAK